MHLYVVKLIEFSIMFFCRLPDRAELEASIGQLPRVSTEDRVVSVFEPSVPSCLLANLLIFCTIKYYSAVQYSMVT